MTKWIIHLKDGRTFTDKTHYPWDFPQDQISSVERTIKGVTYTICGGSLLSNFFIKTTAGQTLRLQGGPASPPAVIERILGCYIIGKEGPVRLEIAIDQKNNIRVTAKKVDKVTKSGF